MGKRLFVGNLPYSASSEDLKQLFSQCGQVTDVHIVMDRETNRPRGFAFVSYSTDEEAARAVSQMAGKDFGGRPLVVNEARDRGDAGPSPRGPRPGGGGFGRPDGAPRPFGPRPGGARPGGFSSGPRPPGGVGGGRPGGFLRPSPGGFGSAPEIPEEDSSRRRRTPQKKKVEPERERQPKVRAREEEDDRGHGNWRQWIDEDEDTGAAGPADSGGQQEEK